MRAASAGTLMCSLLRLRPTESGLIRFVGLRVHGYCMHSVVPNRICGAASTRVCKVFFVIIEFTQDGSLIARLVSFESETVPRGFINFWLHVFQPKSFFDAGPLPGDFRRLRAVKLLCIAEPRLRNFNGHERGAVDYSRCLCPYITVLNCGSCMGQFSNF